MITKLRAVNFKSWRDTGEVKLAPLTGLFGTNSSGKTSILQVLLMLKQTVDTRDDRQVLHFGSDQSSANLGTFHEAVFGHDADASVALKLSWDVEPQLTVRDPLDDRKVLFRAQTMSFDTVVRELHERLMVDSFGYDVGECRFGMALSEAGSGKEEPRYELISKGFKLKRTQGRPRLLPPPAKCYGFCREATGRYQNTSFLGELVFQFEELFSRTYYLGPLREYPQSRYIWDGERPRDVGARGEYAVPALLAAEAQGLTSPRLARVKRRHEPIGKRIADWLKEWKLIHSFTVQEIAPGRKEYEVRVRKSPRSAEVPLFSVGFGVSQVLPVLTLCYYAPEGATVILEQPEIHLHPSVQMGLADALIDVVKERNVQVILESHSEHLLRRLQRRIAEERLPPEKAALYFCELRARGSTLSPLPLDEYGNITKWPEKFFGDQFGEMAEMTKAAMARKARQR